MRPPIFSSSLSRYKSLKGRSATSQTYSGATLSFGIEVAAELLLLDPRSSPACLFLFAYETRLPYLFKEEILPESSFGPIGPAPGR